jgi:hypothetical protein
VSYIVTMYVTNDYEMACHSCPGSVLFLFKVASGRHYLHTGKRQLLILVRHCRLECVLYVFLSQVTFVSVLP